jgi:DNA-directed RNA polymerase specialized sigma24 family protein
MDKYNPIEWPPIEAAYEDEVGPIDVEVYNTARQLWPQTQGFTRSIFGDSDVVFNLLMKAVVAVSRIKTSRVEQIENLPAYLFQAFKRLVLAEIEKENGHRRLELDLENESVLTVESAVEELDRHILIAELMHRMDGWTCKVFKLLVLNYTFEEIGRMLNMRGSAVRKKYNKRIKRLTDEING